MSPLKPARLGTLKPARLSFLKPARLGTLKPARLGFGDVLRVGGAGLRSRPLRVVLSALGIAIGIAAMISVVGISSSSRADLDRTLAKLGTNLLRVAPGDKLFSSEPAQLPTESVQMISRVGPVLSATATGTLAEARVYRNDHVPVGQTGSIAVLASYLDLLPTVGGELAQGTWLSEATAHFPVTVLGAGAAARLGVLAPGPDVLVWLGGEWFTVAGILAPVPLAPELDSAALIGWPVAQELLGFDGHPTTVYCRADDDRVEAVQRVLAATANPESPLEVKVSRPSDALAAKRATDATFTALLLGLGAVALLVGGVGIANTMVISVLERRSEIGLRRSLGATRGQIRVQFLAESLLLTMLGGSGGVVLGVATTAGYALAQGWPILVPVAATAGGLGVTVVIGALAGIYPAIRAARLSPTEALSVP